MLNFVCVHLILTCLKYFECLCNTITYNCIYFFKNNICLAMYYMDFNIYMLFFVVEHNSDPFLCSHIILPCCLASYICTTKLFLNSCLQHVHTDHVSMDSHTYNAVNELISSRSKIGSWLESFNFQSARLVFYRFRACSN